MLRVLCLLAVGLLIFATSARADGDPPTIAGKTDAEILAMEREDWVGYYTSNVDGSTAGWSQANEEYAAAMQRRNYALPQRNNAKELEGLLRDFGDRSLGIATNYHHCGTFWAHVYGEKDCDAEQAIYAVLGGTVECSEPMTTGQVSRAIQRLEQRLTVAHQHHRASLISYPDAKAD